MRRYVARPRQDRKSELIVGAGLERVKWTAWYFQSQCFVQWSRGRLQEKSGAWDTFWKLAMSRAEEAWVGSPFQTRDAADEKDFEVAIDVFLSGADMVKEDEDRSDREGVYLGRIWARYKGWRWCNSLKAVVAILKLIRWRTGSQCMPARTGVMWQYRDFCVTTRARGFWTNWRRARFDADVPARRELQ